MAPHESIIKGNLKEGDTNIKGEVGEVIAKHHFKGTFSTREYFYTIVNKFNLKEEQADFLRNYWKSFDLVDLRSLIIYEVKTRKDFKGRLKGVKNKIVITPNFSRLCEEARKKGFFVKVIDITLFDNWEYSIKTRDFNKAEFWVHRPRPSGWERQSKSKNK